MEEAFKKFEGIWSAYHLKFFKVCHPQNLLSQLLNTLSHIISNITLRVPFGSSVLLFFRNNTKVIYVQSDL